MSAEPTDHMLLPEGAMVHIYTQAMQFKCSVLIKYLAIEQSVGTTI